MRLLIIGDEITDLEKVNNFSGVLTFFLVRELRAKGIDLTFVPRMPAESDAGDLIRYYQRVYLDGIDHVLAFGTRYLSRIPGECSNSMRMRCRGAVTQIYDAWVKGAPVDCTFTMSQLRRPQPDHHYIGWAADPVFCKPKQTSELRILIDHTDYVERPGDRTEEIIDSALAFAETNIWHGKFSGVRVRRIVDGGFADAVVPDSERYSRQPCSYPQCCEEYSKTHLFMVTHPEGLGLSILETAMAGTLPVIPDSYVRTDRANTVRNIIWSGDIPWKAVLDKISIEESRNIAMKNSWNAVASRMLKWFKQFRK